MPVSDQIGDFLTRIRNGGAAGHSSIEAPASKLKENIAAILKDQGYIEDYEVINNDVQGTIKVRLRYFNKVHVIHKIERVSKPGRRVYCPADQLPRIKNGLGIAIISTSKGIMSDKQARAFNVGGEIICTIW
ncbi:MAG TPA: 30S ribosomal protein S8 [Candidatus Kapabacteria bacterium]|jgi:small subunit ribosomal protein S8|nr:30S ribosomal protein S8 [Candidatus Kapabacteria bacterium]HOV92169.1 30S ribosomal protein S8 [Candidatus Kapabacteria bacterium]